MHAGVEVLFIEKHALHMPIKIQIINLVRGREWIAVQWMVCIAYGGVLL
jgi:hypothetical protein